jgi:hypothetical protein
MGYSMQGHDHEEATVQRRFTPRRLLDNAGTVAIHHHCGVQQQQQ